jgi:hypothetical protein
MVLRLGPAASQHVCLQRSADSLLHVSSSCCLLALFADGTAFAGAAATVAAVTAYHRLNGYAHVPCVLHSPLMHVPLLECAIV